MAKPGQKTEPTNLTAPWRLGLLLGVLVVLVWLTATFADEIELTDGKRFQGTVVERSADAVTFKIGMPNGSSVVAKFPIQQVRSLKVAGETPVEKPPDKPPVTDPPKPKPDPPKAAPTDAEIAALIEKAGKAAPDWWDTVKANPPSTLDLAGTKSSRKPLENVVAYKRFIVDPYPAKWKEGIKTFQLAVDARNDDKPRQGEAMDLLASAYFGYLKDWAHAAYWWHTAIRAGWTPTSTTLVHLAECYAKLGSKPMAVEFLKKYGLDSRVPDKAAIALWAELGEMETALRVAEQFAKTGDPDAGYLAAANAFRSAGEFTAAADCYAKVVALQSGSRLLNRNKDRARACLEAFKPLGKFDLARVPDGTYEGSARGLRGPVNVQVTVRDKRIVSVKVTKYSDDWPYFSRAQQLIPVQIVENQGFRDVDAVSGATFSSEGLINAVAKALASAVK